MILITALGGMQAKNARAITGKVTAAEDGAALPGVNVLLKGTVLGTVTDANGAYRISIPDGKATLVFSMIGFQTRETAVGNSSVVNVSLQAAIGQLNEVVVTGYGQREEAEDTGAGQPSGHKVRSNAKLGAPGYYSTSAVAPQDWKQPDYNTEEYDGINENIFHGALNNPLSTFSIDVDAASYSNVRRFINNGQRPPKDAVRIEEMVNYFDYDYPQPAGEDPFAIYTEISVAPWNSKHKLVHIGLQGKNIPTASLPPSNLAFLIDVSGSMSDPNKLPLLKSSFRMLVEQLREQDRVAIVVYAGAAGLVLPSTPGADKKTIIKALNELEAGGSTAGGEGIRLAYAVAKEHFIKNGNNRVILATDGDFNVGESSNAAMERLIEEKEETESF